MTSRFEVDPADLYAHGGHVHAIADAVTEARTAGEAAHAGADAYGQLCAAVPVMLGALQSVLIDEIADSAAAVRDTGDKVRAVAAGYELEDRETARRFEGDR